jgi:hypothetical protein
MNSFQAAILKAAGQTLPSLQVITALIDTGASSTVVDRTFIAKLGVSQMGTTVIHTPSTGGQPSPVRLFGVALTILGNTPGSAVYFRPLIPVIEADLVSQGGGFGALIGRDILRSGLVFYNGVTGTYTLSF